MTWSGLAPYLALVVAIAMPLLIHKRQVADSRKTERWKSNSSQLRLALAKLGELKKSAKVGEDSLLTSREIYGLKVGERISEIKEILEPDISKDSELNEALQWITVAFGAWHLTGMDGKGAYTSLLGQFERSFDKGLGEDFWDSTRALFLAEIRQGVKQHLAYVEFISRIEAADSAVKARM